MASNHERERSSKYPTVDFLGAYNWLGERFPHLLRLSGQDLHEPSPSALCVWSWRPAASEEAMLRSPAGEYTNCLPFHPSPAWAVRHSVGVAICGVLVRWACNTAISRQSWVTRPVKRLLLSR